jgi:tripartite-type tricarboxylate transporter receptor subunit TctC
MRFSRALGMLLLGMPAVSWAQAHTYPTRPLRIIVPYPPGASTDYTARLIGARLTDAFGQSVVVENRGGAGGIIAADLAAQAVPDGYTLFFGTPASLCISPALQRKVPYDTQRDFAPISRLVLNPQILVTAPGFPARNVAELVQLARSRPGQLTYASVGIGSPQHLGIELLKSRAGIDMVHVPYKGSAPALTDLMGGSVTLMFDTIPSAVSHVKGGKLRALGVTGARRSPLFPDVPTIAESGLPGYEVVSWYGLIGPAGIPAPIVGRLNAEATKAAQSAGFRGRMEPLGFDIVTAAPEKMVEMLQADSARWAALIKAAGVTIN